MSYVQLESFKLERPIQSCKEPFDVGRIEVNCKDFDIVGKTNNLQIAVPTIFQLHY